MSETLTPAVLERVGRYMRLQFIRPTGTYGFWIKRPADAEQLVSLPHLAADVLDKLVSDGVKVFVSAGRSLATCDTLVPNLLFNATTWPEAVLLAAAAVQEAREPTQPLVPERRSMQEIMNEYDNDNWGPE